MPDWLFRLRNLVWSAVLAAVSGLAAVVAAFVGCSLEIVAGLGVFGVIFAILTPK